MKGDACLCFVLQPQCNVRHDDATRQHTDDSAEETAEFLDAESHANRDEPSESSGYSREGLEGQCPCHSSAIGFMKKFSGYEEKKGELQQRGVTKKRKRLAKTTRPPDDRFCRNNNEREKGPILTRKSRQGKRLV